MDEQQDLLGSTAVFNKFIHNKLYLLRLLPCHFFMSCLEKRFAQPKKIRKIMIGTDLNIKPVTCGLPAKQSQPSAVKLVEIHVGIILSETKKLVFFWNKTCFTSCLMRSFPIYIYGFTSWMSKRFPKKHKISTPWVETYSNPVISKFAGGSDVLDPIAGSKRWSC